MPKRKFWKKFSKVLKAKKRRAVQKVTWYPVYYYQNGRHVEEWHSSDGKVSSVSYSSTY